MTRDEFWSNLRETRYYGSRAVRSDSTRGNASRIANDWKSAALWLTPEAVDGFDPADFHFLTPEERQELNARVEEYRRVASAVPVHGPAADEQVQAASEAFGRILEILRPDENPDFEAFRASRVLENLRFPEVVKIVREFDTDSTGDPAIRVWVILKDQVAEAPTFFEKAVGIRDRIALALRRQGIRRWPYIHFRTASEQRGLERAGRR